MIPCNKTNYQTGRSSTIQYLVIHYTANNGDTAKGNCSYFQKNPGLYASAHYLVDENGWEQSVADGDTAWHCGATTYRHPKCRNNNSLGIELCSRKDTKGVYYFLPETVQNAQKLARALMEQYRIPKENVLRHYDVTGKVCPAPFVENTSAWTSFLNGLAVKEQEENMEETMTQEQFDTMMKNWLMQRESLAADTWSAEDRKWAEDNGIIKGDAKGEKRYKSFVTREELVATLHRVDLQK